MKYFKIRNWDKFQHYSNRAPIWIKLYTNMIEDQTGDWARWSDILRGQIVGIWQLAAKTGNCMPFDNEVIAEEILATHPVDLNAYGKHLDIYPSKRDCLASISASVLSASGSARVSMVRCFSPSSSSSSSDSDSEGVSKKKHSWVCRLCKKHGLKVPDPMTEEQADEIIDTYQDKPAAVGPRAPAQFPPEDDLTPEEIEKSKMALEGLRKDLA